MTKQLLILLTIFTFGISAQAAKKYSTHSLSAGLGVFSSNATYTGSVTTGSNDTDTNLSTNISGFFDLGVEYNYRLQKTMALGAMLKYFSTSDDVTIDVERSVSAFVIGPIWRQFLRAGKTEFSVGAGFSYMSMTVTSKADAASDPSENADGGMFTVFYSLSADYWISPTFGIGIEHTEHTAMGSVFNGTPLNDWLLRGTFGF